MLGLFLTLISINFEAQRWISICIYIYFFLFPKNNMIRRYLRYFNELKNGENYLSVAIFLRGYFWKSTL